MSSTKLETVRSEDFIEYYLFPELKISENVSVQDTFQTVIQQINAIAEQFCEKYIWHKDRFRVTPRYANASLLIENQLDNCEQLPPHIYGITHFEENIQDEWFIVSLLYEVTRQLPEIVVRAIDSDGEFILIEAADHLPAWANPETCEQRVYIYKGCLHLIRDAQSPTNTLLPVSEAVKKLRNNPTLYKVSNDIEQCIANRLKKFPAHISDELHRATVYLPVSAAALLKKHPQFVADAVRAFCYRDQIDMRACRAMKHFPPESCVYTTVIFTKCLYAMLMHNRFLPDRRTGWNIPPQSNSKHKSHMLGIKLACGFEILASQAKPNEDLFSNKGWLMYLDTLKKRGYFQEYLEHSNDYNRLLDVAKEYFATNVDSMPYGMEVGNHMLNVLKTVDCSTDDFHEVDDLDSDNDDWLNVSPEELDKMLNAQYGVTKIFNSKRNDDASEFTENISEFLDKKSEFDGVDVKPVPPKRGVKKGKVNISEQTTGNSGIESPSTNQIDFNPDAFQSHIKEMLDLMIPEDNWESNSDMSDFEDDDDLERNIAEMANSAKMDHDNLKAYMDQMDRELAATTVGKSFEKKQQAVDDSFEDIESFKPVDIDVNALKNFAQSYQSQYGGPGPATSLLGSLGVQFGKTDHQSEDDAPLYNTQV